MAKDDNASCFDRMARLGMNPKPEEDAMALALALAFTFGPFGTFALIIDADFSTTLTIFVVAVGVFVVGNIASRMSGGAAGGR